MTVEIVRRRERLNERLEIHTTAEVKKQFERLRVDYNFKRRHDLLVYLLQCFKEPLPEERQGERRFL